jgi:hypothetical protein
LKIKSIGLIVSTEKSPTESKSTFEVVGKFNKIVSWHLDEPKVKENSDVLYKAVNEWLSASKIVRII